MATVKVKLRNSTVDGRPGTIFYQVCYHRQVQQITTSLHLIPDHWDRAAGRVAGTDLCEELQGVQRRIDGDVKLLQQIICSFESRREEYTVRDISAHFRDPNKRVMLLGYMQEQILLLTAGGKLGTARNYRRALNSLGTFLGGVDMSLSVFGEQTVRAYAGFLHRRGMVRNSVSFYMRILRAVYNKAVQGHIVEQAFPFRNVYTGVDRTRNRAIGESTVVRLSKLSLEDRPALMLARDLFIFSYCMRGMAFVDIAYLRKSDLEGGAVSYTRHKTGQRLSVRVEPAARRIIDRYASCMPDTPYLFPIIRTQDHQKAYMQYYTALGCYNRRLKELSQLLELDVKLSSYTSRHTWATTARKYNVPISVISAGMGHTSERTTRIYLATLENSVIDKANRRIIASLNG